MTTKYKTNHAKEHKNQQHCTICNAYVKHSERYPDYVCAKCVALATDKNGMQISYFNITNPGMGAKASIPPMASFIGGTFAISKD